METKAAGTGLASIKNVAVDEAALKAHVMRPQHVLNVVSSRGLHEGIAEPKIKFPPGPTFHFDGDGFCKALHAALKDSVAGYVMRLRQHGNTIYTLEWNWAKEPAD